MRRYHGFLTLTILLASNAYAQGNDFPFAPNVPSLQQPAGIPMVTPGFDFQYGQTAYGPVQFPARRGDTIVLDYVLDWWGLGPLSTSIISVGAQNMRWMGPNTRAGQWSHSPNGYLYSCLRCEWRFEAGDDYPAVWIDYTGSSQFGAHLELKQVIPAPRSLFSVLTDPDKSTAGSFAVFFSAASGVFTGAAAAFGLALDPVPSAISSVMAYGADKFATHYNEIARDPWDDNYCSPTPWQIDQETVDAIQWFNVYDTTGGWLVYSIEVADGFGIFAVTAANRALSAEQVGAWDCADQRRGEAIWALNQMGSYVRTFGWSTQTIADQYAAKGYDMSFVYQQFDTVMAAGAWLEGLQ